MIYEGGKMSNESGLCMDIILTQTLNMLDLYMIRYGFYVNIMNPNMSRYKTFRYNTIY